jgi:hypothetical protein
MDDMSHPFIHSPQHRSLFDDMSPHRSAFDMSPRTPAASRKELWTRATDWCKRRRIVPVQTETPAIRFLAPRAGPPLLAVAPPPPLLPAPLPPFGGVAVRVVRRSPDDMPSDIGDLFDFALLHSPEQHNATEQRNATTMKRSERSESY